MSLFKKRASALLQKMGAQMKSTPTSPDTATPLETHSACVSLRVCVSSGYVFVRSSDWEAARAALAAPHWLRAQFLLRKSLLL